jgi:uncharacterized protein (UPF0210 family)
MMTKPIIRTITAFINFQPTDFGSTVSWDNLFTNDVSTKVDSVSKVLQAMEFELKEEGYTVQTVRLATNPFGQWLVEDDINKDRSKKTKKEKLQRLTRLDNLLSQNKIEFCSVGPAMNRQEATLCLDIVSKSHRFSCSVDVPPGNVSQADVAAETIVAIAKIGTSGSEEAPPHLKGGLGNFRFCAAASCKPFIPFFPAAKSDDSIGDTEVVRFAIGLENGPQAQELLKGCGSIGKISTDFKTKMAEILAPVQGICEKVAKENKATFLGIDSSLNPSLEETGSVGSAIEMLSEVKEFGGPGTLGAAAEITRALQSLEGIKLTGYCGLMLPVCEDTRLAKLASSGDGRQLRITDLLSISSVCGVGVDTVPIPGDAPKEDISSLILDVAGIAGRWDKSLSCRVFPVPGSKAGDKTDFDSPYMVNSNVFSLS